MSKSVGELQNIEDVLVYWRECLAMLGDTEDQKVAGYMVNIVTSDHFDEWYQGEVDPAFTEVFDLVTALEVPNGITEIGNDDMRKTAWKRVVHLVETLGQKFLR